MNKPGSTLLFLIPGFPADETDTSCLPAQQLLVKALNKLFPEVKIIILSFQYPYTDKEYNWFGNRVIPFNGQNKRKLYRLLLWKKVWVKMKQLKNETHVLGVFSCWCSECALVGKYFSKKHSLKHFIWVCGQDARKGNKLVKIIHPSPASLIAISDFLADTFFKNHHIRPARIIPIGIDPEMYAANKLPEKDIDILGAGSLIPLKQFDQFIEIVKELKMRLPSIKTIISGEGPERKNLQNLIKRYGLQDNILLPGEKPHSEVLQLMQRSKILLHPSAYEGLGAVCIEALYAGAHVVSFCKPFHKKKFHWHTVETTDEMLREAGIILLNNNTDFSSVMVNDVKTSAISIMKLFEHTGK
ncbi:MAG: glycosyltransferase [Panacibacter sp.]